MAALKLTLPVLVDDMENTVATAYHAMPDRLFIVGADARIAYRGARGPRGFDVDELESALKGILKAAAKKAGSPQAGSPQAGPTQAKPAK